MDTALLNVTNQYRDLALKEGAADVLLICDLLELSAGGGGGCWTLWSEAFRLATAGGRGASLALLWAAHLGGQTSRAVAHHDKTIAAYTQWKEQVEAREARAKEDAENRERIDAMLARKGEDEPDDFHFPRRE